MLKIHKNLKSNVMEITFMWYGKMKLLSLPTMISSFHLVMMVVRHLLTKNISNNTGDSQHAQISVKGNNVYVVWDDSTRDVYDIFFAMSTDGGLTFTTKIISNNPEGGYGSENPQISSQGNNVYVVWQQDGRDDNFPDIFITRSTDGGQTFSEPDNISNIPGGSRFPQISSEGDNVYVVWEDAGALNDEDTFFSFSHDSGQTFSEPFNISNMTSRSFSPQISSQGNNVYVVWEEFSDDRDIFFAGRYRRWSNIYYQKPKQHYRTFAGRTNLINRK